jgi:NAD(P)-dependent dehydrogenase (short-subunit alcohol dehydrogenase family)
LVAPFDVSAVGSFSAVVAAVLLDLKGRGLSPTIDVLVNNAGVSSRGNAIDTDAATMRSVMGELYLA